jgi:hypothetical protein
MPQVENTLFRIPLYFFNEASATFAALLEKNDVSRIIHITDPDVSASAFANLLKVLRTPYVLFEYDLNNTTHDLL